MPHRARRGGVLLASAVLLLPACRPTMDEPTANRLVAEARKLDLAGYTDEAIARYRQVLDARPASYDAHYGIARALDLAGRYRDAREHFARAIELAAESDKDQVLRMMGIAWTFEGRADEAARYFQQVYDRRIAAGNEAGAAEVANELGRVYLELGSSALAEQWYRAGHEAAGRERDRPARQVDLAEFRFAHARARLAARAGNEAEARREVVLAKQLLDKGGNDDQRVQYEYLRGYVEFHAKQYDAAVAALERADAADPFIALLLGQTYDALGRTDRARDEYARVLRSTSHAVASAIARPVARQKLGLTR